MFPNYYHSMRGGHGKIDKQEEALASKELIDFKKQVKTKKDKKNLKDRKKGRSKSKNAKNNKNASRKAYLTDNDIEMDDEEFEDRSEDADFEGNHADFDGVTIKNLPQKATHIFKLKRKKFDKMKFRLDCGFSLLVYGIGSKIDFINLFT